MENLNLRGDYKPKILDYINNNHPELNNLYHQIYIKNDRSYWKKLDNDINNYCKENNYKYYRAIDEIRSRHGEKPVVNYFYHEEVKKVVKEKIN